MHSKLICGLVWKLLERFGSFGVQFIVSVVLARQLDPSYYGMLTIMNIFVLLANVFVQGGLGAALIQSKSVEEEDYSSIFWVSMAVAVVLYAGLFWVAPAIADLYNMPQIVAPFRVLTLFLIPAAFNSVQLAKVSREMDFRKVFFGNINGVVISGIVGIALAYGGFGLWALVAQNLTNMTVTSITMLFTVDWRPRLICNVRRVKGLFQYGWKLLVSGLIDTLYTDLSSLLVGKKYDATALGFYSRGLQFPQTVINPINGAIQSVLLPAMSEEQDDRQRVKTLTHRAISLGSFIIFPLMIGLAGVAESLIQLLLTEKWLPCVPYLQAFCIVHASYYIDAVNLQAIKAMGRSDIFLKLEIVKKAIGLIGLGIALLCFRTPLAMALAMVAMIPLNMAVNAYPNKALIGYTIGEQLKAIVPPLLVCLAMLATVLAVKSLGMGALATLALQVLVGVAVYVALSAALRIEALGYLWNLAKGMRKP